MITRQVGVEFSKLRRLHTPLICVLGVLAMSLFSLMNLFTASGRAEASHPDSMMWERLLISSSSAVALTSSVLVAILARRQVDIEHQQNGWMLSGGAGIGRGSLLRTKFVVLALITAAMTAVELGLVIAVGRIQGIAEPLQIVPWLGFGAAVLLVSLALVCLQLLVSARWENQLIAMGLGLMGAFLGMFSITLPRWAAHLFLWGYFALAEPIDIGESGLLTNATSWTSVLGLALVAGVLFWWRTARLDQGDAR